jgi:hypothetical protein
MCGVWCVRVLKVYPGKLLTIQIKNIGGNYDQDEDNVFAFKFFHYLYGVFFFPKR